jgi:hypothetical protein
MHKLFKSRVTAVATGAVVVVGLGATGATAAGMIGSDDIKNNSVRSVDIHDGSVQGDDIQRDAVGTAEIAPGSVRVGNLTEFAQGLLDDRAEMTRLRQRVAALAQEVGSDSSTTVADLTGEFSATNNSVSLTADGVEFGPYADGGGAGGSVFFDGLNGEPVSSVSSLVYYARYTSQADTAGVGAPYLRIFTENDANSWIFSPNTQTPDPDVAEGPFHEWVATSGTWRYDDDAGAGPESSFADLVAQHGDETISGIYVTTGFSAGSDLSSLLRWMDVNGERYTFAAGAE